MSIRVVLAVHLAELIGGAERLLLNFLAGNREYGTTAYDVVFFHDGPLVAMVADLGYPVRVFEAGELSDFDRFVYTTTRLATYLERIDPDVVMAWKGGSHLYASLAAQLVRRPEVWWQQELPLGCRSDRLLTMMPAVRIFCVSRASAVAQSRMWPQRPMTVIHPCVEASFFQDEAVPSIDRARSLLGIPGHRPLVGMLGRLVPGKGAEVFLQAATMVLKAFPDAMFAVVGGPQRGWHESYAEFVQGLPGELGIADKVLMPGQVSQPALWIQAMDVVVHAASQPEAFGMVIPEAMALGKPVIASDAGGPREIISDGVDGLLSPPGDVNRLAAAICGLLSDQQLARRLSERARVRARDFQRARFVAQVDAALAELV